MVNTSVVISKSVKTVVTPFISITLGSLALYQEALTRHIPRTREETFFFQGFHLTGECLSLENIQSTQAVHEQFGLLWKPGRFGYTGVVLVSGTMTYHSAIRVHHYIRLGTHAPASRAVDIAGGDQDPAATTKTFQPLHLRRVETKSRLYGSVRCVSRSTGKICGCCCCGGGKAIDPVPQVHRAHGYCQQ